MQQTQKLRSIFARAFQKRILAKPLCLYRCLMHGNPRSLLETLEMLGVRTYINIDLFNKDAKKVFKLDEYATSKKSVALVSGAPVMNYDKLMPMCKNATEELLDDLNKKIPKIAKKVDKKL